LTAALGARGLQPWTECDLSRETGIAIGQLTSAIAELTRSGALVDLPIGPRRSVRVPAEVAAALEDRVLRALARLHEMRPRQSAIPRSHVIAALPGMESEAMIAGVLERLKARGKVIGDAKTVALKEFQPKLSQGERKLKTELAEAIRAGEFSPPEVADLNAMAGSRASAVPELLALLRDEERLVEITPQLYLDEDIALEMRHRVVDRLRGDSNGAGTLTMAELRDLLGTSRKYAVPLGEYLDRIGVTTRDGDTRRLGPAASSNSV
jgi:selenocysteine-specific elongation factor